MQWRFSVHVFLKDTVRTKARCISTPMQRVNAAGLVWTVVYLNAQGMLAELQALKSGQSTSALPRLGALTEALVQAMEVVDRLSPAGIAAALSHQAIRYLYEGIEGEQCEPEIKRRFALAVRRAEGWAMASAQAHPNDPRLARPV